MDTSNAITAIETPAGVWTHFAELCAIPRVSRNEAQVREYVLRIAAATGAESSVDAKGNVVVRVPATKRRPSGSSGKGVVVQSHLDMVPDSAPGVDHDFAVDPIVTVREGEWLTTGGRTTLGADNGIGVSLALALLTEPNVSHGPLELLFTVEEEIGLLGALALDPTLVESRTLINLDNEDPTEILVGCAGGAGVEITFSAATAPTSVDQIAWKVSVTGLLGGHSGVEIHKHRANAIKTLVRVLSAIASSDPGFRICSLTAGTVTNKIPSLAEAVVVTSSRDIEALRTAFAAEERAIREEYSATDPSIHIDVAATERPEHSMTDDETTRLCGLISDLPDGVQAMSSYFDGVETSCNLAVVRISAAESQTAAGQISISCRSLVAAEIPNLQAKIAAIAMDCGAEARCDAGYPGWEPSADSRLLQMARTTYKKVYGMEPRVTVIHAGAECGTIISRIPGTEAIAIGPRIEEPHTPRERVNIASVTQIWTYLTALIGDLATE